MATLKLTNRGDTEIRDAFANQEYRVPPGQTAIVPDDAVKLWFGNYEAMDRERDQARSAEYARIKVRYGCSDDPEMWERDKPQVSVEDIEGNHITTVIEDPTGETIEPPPASSTDLIVLEQEVQKLARQNAILIEEIERRKAQDSASQVILPEDSPANAPTPRVKRDQPKAPRDE